VAVNSKLHYSKTGDGTFGLLIWRVIQRNTETVTWPLYRMSRSGLVSQFGTLTGLDGLESPGHTELTPYLLTKNVQGPASSNYDRNQQLAVGGGLKHRIASNLVLDATVNPDFGQVEADPSELNLSAFETFFSERRPFFVEGKGLFTFNVNCVVVLDCNTGEGLFYSRRTGRAPQLDAAGAAEGFNVRQFRSNTVVRWEYLPGSTLFLVWSQGRQGSSLFEGAEQFSGDLHELFRQRANDIFLVKLSYWIAR